MRIQLQKEEMQRKLDEASMQYAQMKKEQETRKINVNDDDLNDSDDDYEYNNYNTESKCESKYSSPIHRSSTNTNHSSKYTPDSKHDDHDYDSSAKLTSYTPEVEVKLVDSYEYKGEDVDDNCYVVEENSDDES